MNMMGKPRRSPTHIDMGHRLAEIAAELAGYDLDALCDGPGRTIGRDGELYRSFVKKGFAAVDLLAPAVVSYETESGDRVPDEVWQAANQTGDHALKAVRTWRGMTVEELASASGLSVELITQIEARQVIASEMHDMAIARALNVVSHALTDWRAATDEPAVITKLQRQARRDNRGNDVA